MTTSNQTQTPDPGGSRPFAALRAGLESLSQMNAALCAAQELPARLSRFLEILSEASEASRAAIFQAEGTAGELKLLAARDRRAGLDLNEEQFQAEEQIQESVRRALRGEISSRDSAAAIPLPAPSAPTAVLYLEAVSPEALPLARAAAGGLALALQAEQQRQERQKFVSVVTHEVRIPMTSIKGYTDLLRQGLVGPVNADQQSFLNVIRNNVERMSALVSDLSDLNRMDSGRLRVKLAALDLKSCIQEAVDGVKAAIEEKGQSITIEAGDLPAVRGDQSRVVQILTALLNNAHLYSPANTEIVLSAKAAGLQASGLQAGGSEAVVAVRDQGAGISEQDQAHVFEPFFRSEDPAIREHPGWGLSLSVARGLLHMMQGRIGFESKPGSGSLFWIRLPLDSGRGIA